MQLDSLDDLVPNGVNRTKCRHWFLRDQSDFVAPNVSHPCPMTRHFGEDDEGTAGRPGLPVAAAKQNLAFADASRLVHQLQNGPHRDAFAATAFADDAHHSSGHNLKTYAINGSDHAFGQAESDMKITHTEKRRGHRRLTCCRDRTRLAVHLQRG